MTPEVRSPRCDFCDQSAVALTGETNGILVCERHRPAPEDRDTQGNREALAELLAEHSGPARVAPGYGCGCGAHLTEAYYDSWRAYRTHIADVLAAHVARARAEALREAADEARFPNLGWEAGGHTSAYSVRRWLRERADRIDPGADQ